MNESINKINIILNPSYNFRFATMLTRIYVKTARDLTADLIKQYAKLWVATAAMIIPYPELFGAFRISR